MFFPTMCLNPSLVTWNNDLRQCIIEFGGISKLFSSTKVLSIESIAFFALVLVDMLTLTYSRVNLDQNC